MALAAGKKESFFAGFGISFFTAFFICILEVIFVLAFTALIYSGDLSAEIPRAMGFILLGDALLCLTIAALSSYSGFIGIEQDVPGAMQGVVAAGLIAALAGSTSAQFATVTLMVVITTLMTGVLLLILGYFKLGGLARFLPYPVIGGFLAGSGWLLIQGGISIMTDLSIGMEWFSASAPTLWMPGLLLGLLIYFASRKINQPYTIPALLLASGIIFYGVVGVAGVSLPELRVAGWLLDINASSTIWESPLSPTFLADVDWAVLLAQLPSLIPISIISIIALLLNSSGMEVLVKKDIDLNRELMVAGAGNLSAGLAGGLVGFQDISFSALSRNMSGGKRLVGILTALMLAGTLFIGTSAVTYIPKFIFGSVLVYLGFELVISWVYESWFKFSRIDFLAVIAIMVTMAVYGVMQSVIVGLILAVVMFAVSYSRVSVVKFAFTGHEYHSRVTRAPHEQRILYTHGHQLHIMKLEGFIFFGTANSIFETLRNRIKAASGYKVKYALLDFSKVSGMDATGILSFDRMIQWCQEQGILLVFSGLDKKTQQGFMQANTGYATESMKFFPNMDRALEWCENEIIAANLESERIHLELGDQLNAILNSTEAEKLLPYLQRHEYKAGEYLIREGDSPDLLYFVHSGQVTAQIESIGREPVRLETMNSGRTVGEVGFFLGNKRTASVIADQDTVAYTLSMDNLKELEIQSPEIANLFHKMSVLLLSERVTHLIRTVSAMERA